jgi:hypothetical protein
MSGIVARYKVECEESNLLNGRNHGHLKTTFELILTKVSDNCGSKKVALNIDGRDCRIL